jgi:hypothetical protein
MFNHVERDKCFAGIHAGLKSFKLRVSSSKFVGKEVTSLKLSKN